MAQESKTPLLPYRRRGSAREAKLSRGRRVIHSRVEKAPGPEHCVFRGRSASARCACSPVQMPRPELNPVGHSSTPCRTPNIGTNTTPIHLLQLVATSQDPPASQQWLDPRIKYLPSADPAAWTSKTRQDPRHQSRAIDRDRKASTYLTCTSCHCRAAHGIYLHQRGGRPRGRRLLRDGSRR